MRPEDGIRYDCARKQLCCLEIQAGVAIEKRNCELLDNEKRVKKRSEYESGPTWNSFDTSTNDRIIEDELSCCELAAKSRIRDQMSSCVARGADFIGAKNGFDEGAILGRLTSPFLCLMKNASN